MSPRFKTHLYTGASPGSVHEDKWLALGSVQEREVRLHMGSIFCIPESVLRAGTDSGDRACSHKASRLGRLEPKGPLAEEESERCEAVLWIFDPTRC